MNREVAVRCEDLPKFTPSDKAMATREVGGMVLNALANVLPEIMGGSADLAPSTKTDIKSSHDFQIGKRFFFFPLFFSLFSFFLSFFLF